MKKLLQIIFALFILFGCEPHQKVDAPGLRDAVENRKIKKIKAPEIQQRALKIGSELITLFDSILIKNYVLNDSLNCEMIDTNLFSTNSEEIKTNIICDLRSGDEMEMKLFDALKYNFENNIEYTTSVQKYQEKYYVIHPIQTKQKFIGAISIVIPKKEVILAISDDTWKYKYKKRDEKKKNEK